MKLEQYQMMGEQSPYKTGLWENEESDLEDESDDDLIVEEMSDEKFKSIVVEMVKSIFESSFTIDVGLINLRQIKHGYSKDNFDCAGAIYPAMFHYIGTHLIQTSMKLIDKKTALEDIITQNLEMFTTFVHTDDEQLNAIYLTALICSKIDSLRNVFHLILQLFYSKDLFESANILCWINQ